MKAGKGRQAAAAKRKLHGKANGKKQQQTRRVRPVRGQFPIVGIGASAGGLEALEQFFSNTPEDNGMSFVVIQHLDPTHKGIMPELLQRITSMEVVPVTDGLKVKPNSVYVIPPNTSMSVLNNTLHLFEPVETRGLRLPIDFFFRSLAEDKKDKSIGIILSGMGSDGSMGLRSIKEVGGLVLVQDPGSAKFDGMPRSAIDAVTVDIVAPSSELPQRLISYVNNTSAVRTKVELEQKDKSALDKIIILLRSQTGHDFSLYKKSTMYRRVERRMNVHKIDKIAYYVRYLQENPAEVNILFKELLIGVTSFFRDVQVWEKLREKIIPEMLSKVPEGHLLRVWIPACSTGEEAFSLAIIFREVLEGLKNPKTVSLQIFATDIDADAINKARKGVYPLNISADVSRNRLRRFFIKTEYGYRVTPGIRDLVVFAAQDITKDPPFTNLDMLICRNLLIYMEPELQKKLIALFNYSLKPGGVLLLGSAETSSNQSRYFTPLENKLRIYRQTGASTVNELFDFPKSFSRFADQGEERMGAGRTTGDIQNFAEQLVLQKYSPASVIVNSKGDILYIIGRTGKYFEPAAGKANMNIFAMARRGLQREFPAAFRQAMENNKTVVLHNLLVGTNGGSQVVDITIQPIDKPDAFKGLAVVVFSDSAETNELKPTAAEKGKRHSGTYVRKLEMELQQAKEDLQSTLEEMQTSQEELKSTNEELQSTNEELQSTNEELTTSKEEMQSLNEELQTANFELQNKVDDFSRLESDMKNLLDSTEIATLFLDRNLQIRRYTSEVTRVFKLIPGDIGRPFTDLVSELVYPEISIDALEVLRTLVFIEKSVSTRDGKWYMIRIMPYRTVDDKIDGLVMTFIDVTHLKTVGMALRDATDVLRSVVLSAPNAILSTTPDGKVVQLNEEAQKLVGGNKEDIIGKNCYELSITESLQEDAWKDLMKRLERNPSVMLETNVGNLSGTQVPVVWSVNKLFNENGEVESLLFIQRKKAGNAG